MSRTEEVRNSGARPIGGDGDNAPFIKWGNSYAWVEGVIESFWEGDFGKVARLRVTNAHPELEGQKSKDEPREGIDPGNDGQPRAIVRSTQRHRGAPTRCDGARGVHRLGRDERRSTISRIHCARIGARTGPAGTGIERRWGLELKSGTGHRRQHTFLGGLPNGDENRHRENPR